MADQNTYTPHYSLADIEQYLQGKMTATEMYALEKAALQDPFLADAIEGYNAASMSEAHEHLHEIHELLLPGKEAKIVRLSATGNKGWRRAAIAILLLGAGIITWLLLPDNSRKQELAQAPSPVVVSKKVADSTTVLQRNSIDMSANSQGYLSSNQVKTDTSALSLLNAPAKGNRHLSRQSNVDTSSSYNANVFKELPGTKWENGEAGSLEKKTADSIQFSPKSATANIEKDKAANSNAAFPVNVSANRLQGKISNQKGEAIAGASVNVNNSNRNIVTDANGNFSFTSPDTSANIVVNSLGYIPQQNRVNTHASNSIILQENTNALNDITIVGYTTAKRESTAGAPPADNKMNIMKVDTLMPEGGWDKFKLYVANSIAGNNLDDLDNIDIHGELEFEFRVDNNGRVKDVTILESPDENKNGVIAEALKQGPRWTTPDKKKKRKNKAIIRF